MKRFKWLLPIGILAFFLALSVTAVTVGTALLQSGGKSLSVGRYLETAGAGHMLILDNAPVSASSRPEDRDLFAGLSSGDKVLVIHDGIRQSYPGQTSVWYCLRLEEGSPEDIPQDILRSLQDLGWLPPSG